MSAILAHRGNNGRPPASGLLAGSSATPLAADSRRPGIVMLLSTAEASLGGTQKQAVRLARELRRRGLEVRLVAKATRRSAVLEDTDGVPVVRLPVLRRQPAWSFLVSFVGWAVVNRRRFDIVHAHNTHVGVIACLAGWLLGKKVVIKIPGMLYVDYLRPGSGWRAVRRRILTSRVDRFVAVSREMVAALRASGVPATKVAFLPNGIEVTDPPGRGSLADRAALFGNPTATVALFVGRLVDDKGLDRLLPVWASLPARHGAVLVIVGDGPRRAALESLAVSLGLRAGVRFVGHRRDVGPFYANADVFVLPSRTEGISNALLEAMAAGLPVVASDIGGNRDVVEDGRSGFLVDWDDRAAPAGILATLLGDPHLRARVGWAAHERALSFAIDRVADGYQQLYRQVLEP